MEWKELLTKQRQKEKKRIISNENSNTFFKWFSEEPDYAQEFNEDYMAIISSQAFRKLQDKTQVFLLDRSDFVRTRLTHSFEVSTISKQIVNQFVYRMRKEKPEEIKAILAENEDFENQIETVVACAGLLHDTGNPPYGHYGEEVIRHWFRKKFADKKFAFRGKPIRDILTKQMRADFENFEGNAQGLRIMSKSRLKGYTDYDVNLTFAVMNTLVKYPNPSDRFDKKSPDLKLHKNGYYHSEEDIMDQMCTATGTKLEDGTYVRHPLVYIMEAADDIAYATADLEDSVMKNAFSLDLFVDYYQKKVDDLQEKKYKRLENEYRADPKLIAKIQNYRSIQKKMQDLRRRTDDPNNKEFEVQMKALKDERNSIFDQNDPVEQEILEKIKKITDEKNAASTPYWGLNKALKDSESEDSKDSKRRRSKETDFVLFENWLSECRNELIRVVAKVFVDHYDEIMQGTYKDDLFKGSPREESMGIMKKIMADYVYDSMELIDMELSAKRIIETLLDDFVGAALYYDELEAPSIVEDRFLHKIPFNFREDYLGAKAKIEADPILTEDEKESEKLYHRLLMVTDYISGMTDIYAANLYKTINGSM